jgi:hypothetical protein
LLRAQSQQINQRQQRDRDNEKRKNESLRESERFGHHRKIVCIGAINENVSGKQRRQKARAAAKSRQCDSRKPHTFVVGKMRA